MFFLQKYSTYGADCSIHKMTRVFHLQNYALFNRVSTKIIEMTESVPAVRGKIADRLGLSVSMVLRCWSRWSQNVVYRRNRRSRPRMISEWEKFNHVMGLLINEWKLWFFGLHSYICFCVFLSSDPQVGMV